MKESKILKALSYIIIPILIAVIIITIIYKIEITDYKEIDIENYFLSNEFVQVYMNDLSSFARQLIHDNNYYSVISNYDTNNQNVEIRYVDYKNNKIEDYYFLIIYNNIAITNVELSNNTDTIEKIKYYIDSNENSKKANIINGIIESTSTAITNRAVRSFQDFNINYYTRNDLPMEEETDYTTVNCTIKDFLIYSSYKEIFKEDLNEKIVQEYIDKLSFINENIYFIIPACSIILFVCLIYLLISIGHSKNVSGIDINDFDKIYFEIILFFAIIGFLAIIFCCVAIYEVFPNDIKFLISGIISAYLIIYSICAVCINTFIKRIKAKIFWKTTIFYKIWKFFGKIYKKTIGKIKNTWNELDKKVGRGRKLIIGVISYFAISIIMIFIFNFFGLLFMVGVTTYLIIEFLEKIKCFEKIENHLKNIYEGKTTELLNENDFTKDFKPQIKYINNISNGFENAVQDRMKSEKLKTELITNVSHDIKTPLTSIINYIDLLDKENIENKNAKKYIKVLTQKSDRLKKLTDDLIEASKASSGNVKLNYEKINIVELLKQAIGEFKDKFESKNLEIINSFSSEEILINADNKYMYRIIENLFSNVTKYALEKSRVYIDVIKKENKVYIDIKNISKESLNISEEELMQRFVRGDKSRTTEGSGLGISISKSLTELHNGIFDIKIDGDLFKVELIFNLYTGL